MIDTIKFNKKNKTNIKETYTKKATKKKNSWMPLGNTKVKECYAQLDLVFSHISNVNNNLTPSNQKVGHYPKREYNQKMQGKQYWEHWKQKKFSNFSLTQRVRYPLSTFIKAQAAFKKGLPYSTNTLEEGESTLILIT